jgi:hypothetical protein
MCVCVCVYTSHSIVSRFQVNNWPPDVFLRPTSVFPNLVNNDVRNIVVAGMSKMNLDETLKLLRQREKETGSLLERAISRKRNGPKAHFILELRNAYFLPAVNRKARIKWGSEYIRGIFEFFDVENTDTWPPVYFLTVADKRHLTSDDGGNFDLKRMKRELSAALRGLSYIGMIEPGYYNNIYDDAGNTVTDVISWHGHFLVWGTTQRQLQKWRSENRHRLTAIMPYMCAVHFKKVASDDLGRVAAYIVKAPRKEYSVGRRREPDRKIPESLTRQRRQKLSMIGLRAQLIRKLRFCHQLPNR